MKEFDSNFNKLNEQMASSEADYTNLLGTVDIQVAGQMEIEDIISYF